MLGILVKQASGRYALFSPAEGIVAVSDLTFEQLVSLRVQSFMSVVRADTERWVSADSGTSPGDVVRAVREMHGDDAAEAAREMLFDVDDEAVVEPRFSLRPAGEE